MESCTNVLNTADKNDTKVEPYTSASLLPTKLAILQTTDVETNAK